MVAFVEKGLLNKSVYKLIFNEPNRNWSIWQQEKKNQLSVILPRACCSCGQDSNLKNAENWGKKIGPFSIQKADFLQYQLR